MHLLAPAGPADERVGPQRMINRQEYIRVVEQALYKLGYDAVAKQLEADSVRARAYGVLGLFACSVRMQARQQPEPHLWASRSCTMHFCRLYCVASQCTAAARGTCTCGSAHMHCQS